MGVDIITKIAMRRISEIGGKNVKFNLTCIIFGNNGQSA